jgi:hypothetical protein
LNQVEATTNRHGACFHYTPLAFVWKPSPYVLVKAIWCI